MSRFLWLFLLCTLGCTAKQEQPAKEGKLLQTTADSVSTIPQDGTEVLKQETPVDN